MYEFLKKEWKYLLWLAVVIVLLVFIYREYQQWKQINLDRQEVKSSVSINTNGDTSKAGEPQLIYLQGQNTNTKEIVYVPKEVDLVTGQQEKTDVQLERKQDKVYVKINGKEFEIPADVQENTKFQNGKLVITENAQMRLNITSPKPYFNLGFGWSKEGPAMQLNGPVYKNISWWLCSDKKNIAGGLQFPIMK